MQVFGGRELVISATTDGTLFLSYSLFAWKLEKVEVRPCLKVFLHTEMAQDFIFDPQSPLSCYQKKRVFTQPRLGADN